MFCLEDKVDSLKRTRGGMKRPLSPVSLENKPSLDVRACVSGRHGDADPQLKHGCKQQSLTLCEVCNIQLNSRTQAQTHYNGKTHQRRLRKANQAHSSGGVNTIPRSPIQASPLLASLPLPGRPLQSPLDLKHFLPMRVNGSASLSLFPNFHTTDPVQKAVINHTFGLPQPVRKKQIISCNICHLRFNSTSQAEAHYRGHKHARRLKASDHLKHKQRKQGLQVDRDRHAHRHTHRQQEEGKRNNTPTLDSTLSEKTVPLSDSQTVPMNAEKGLVTLTPISEASSQDTTASFSPGLSCGSQGSGSSSSATPAPEAGRRSSEESGAGAEEEEQPGGGDVSRQNLHCAICKVTVNSSTQLEAHYSGSKHKLMLEGQCVQPRRRGKVVSSHMNPRPKRHGNKNNATSISQSHHCDVCDVMVNSETQLKQHMSSKRHKDRLAGKPPKPKFSPYNKSPADFVLATKLALQKELSKSLTAGFLPSPLTPATLCTMATNPLTLRHTTTPAAIIPTPLLSPALFRPAPGPLRATHTPIIFSPY